VTPASHAYSLRRVSPLEGVIQVLERDAARAISRDGIDWEIQVETESPNTLWGSLNTGKVQRRFFRFGTWSTRRGLWRVPVNPILDIGEMIEETQDLVAALEAHLAELPFPAVDRFELWLLDTQSRPLAMLATTDDPRRIADLRPQPWQAAPLAEHGFRSPILDAEPARAEDAQNPRRHAAAVETLIRQAAGGNPVQQWFERDAQGGGHGLSHRVPAVLADRELAIGEFPELPWRSEWLGERDAALMADYAAWSAPRLLVLQGLGDPTRAALEAAARRQAEAVEALFRLYPRILDRSLIDAARVEARLRRAARAGA
jgi:hypothetical protein